jgi:Ohr subfamily peroxiredoxin
MQVVYSTQATSTGGREGKSATPDGRLSVTLSTPKELGGAGGPGSNPEQLFAAGYSACFIGALKFVAGQEKVKLPSEPEITGIVGIGANPKGVGFAITAELQIKLEGLNKEVAKALVEKAHQVCPYSNATRNNVDVTLTLV